MLLLLNQLLSQRASLTEPISGTYCCEKLGVVKPIGCSLTLRNHSRCPSLILHLELSGFQQYTAEPHLIVTTLRNPLELYVSGEQYLNRETTGTLPAATQHVDKAMRTSLESHPKLPGFLHRLVGRRIRTTAEIREATVEGAYNLQTFWLVGVMEQYTGFVSVMRTLLDSSNVHADLWEPHIKHKLNASPVQSSNVLASLDPDLVQQFNSTLSYQWLMYGHAVRLFTSRCREVLPGDLHGELCSVPSPPVAYVP